MRVEHEICSTICGTPVRFILDHKNLTGLAGPLQGGVRERKNLPEKWPQFGFGVPQRPPNVPRTPEMDPKWPPQLTLIDLS